MKYFLVAGEASGDLHASNLMRSLQTVDPQAEFRYFGGDLMQSVGGTLLKHYREMAFMGFIPVLMHLRTVLKNLNDCKKAIAEYRPDVVILVDYPGFNLKMAKYVHSQLKIPVYYYISPKIWAWKTYRIQSIRKYVDRLFSILPFEVDFYKKYNYPIDYVGNPTVDALAARDFQNEAFADFAEANQLKKQPVIALLAGSRLQEIKVNLPVMLEAAASFKDYQLIIAGAPGIEPSYYQQFMKDYPISVVFGQTYRLLQHSRAALVTSGTATLETALLRVAQVVCYRISFPRLSTFIFEHFFSCNYISLVNLIAGKTVVKELFGKYFSEQNIHKELDLLLNDENYRRQMDKGYCEVIKQLGNAGASDEVAQQIHASLQQKTE
ncbi:MAG: Lipid-A-disaccharide synthase [Candidatus Ordinivivax streblomastigis]|uniref:Lipid-A-disaccharide synthase n=1 Tax=Candidatus Ordinivivax streblomastigis TaxID=2540710 RepID=A0A5M8P5D2_9BACT|nr:MAG: Lipid-A-disaccharide synthase [Candidatus Ordinivivax streblomastigis]